ncbi:hypothetical protein LENED_000544 [Lentinula edodes]|uniref:Uncharacterized protein n=1 Tax=Lentinula edodes TaxID=5353 RepID=A0A1Q3DVX4_LENED|nr:hypothetical protein LENED_000544 [Lentinula edodes]
MAQHQQLVANGSRLTRAQVQEWRGPWFSRWLTDGISSKLILAWIQKALHLQELVDYSIDDILNLFLSVVVLIYQDTPETALEELTALQRCLAQNYSLHQHNLVLDMVDQIEDLINLDEDHGEFTTEAQIHIEISTSSLVQQCEIWATVLKKELLENTSGVHSKLESAQKKVALNIREMKRVPRSLFNTPDFQAALSMTHLPSVILELSNPVYAYKHGHGPHHAHLLRCHGFGLVLGSILDKWTPTAQMEAAADACKGSNLNFWNESNTKPMKTGAHFFRALKDHPLLIPRISNPASILFLCSEENFIFSWNRWLAWFLNEEKYAIHETNPRRLYQNIQTYLTRLKQEPTAPNWPPELRVIVDRTLDFWRLREEVEDNAFSADKKHCKICHNLPDHEKCVQRKIVHCNEDPGFYAKVKGAGITRVPEKEQMKPRQNRKQSIMPQLYHPDELGLECITADDDIIQRCGKLVILFVDPDIDDTSPGETLDFVWFEAFGRQPGGHFEKLVHHCNKVTAVKPVRRGGKFDLWSSGQMCPYGWRQPSGGRLGDTYAPYAGIEAETLEGIMVLFEHAETSCILMGTAKGFHRKLWRNMKDASRMNYTSPQHADEDCVRSLCAQILLNAEEKWKTRENTLWSFDSSKLHGTMLPSERTVLHLRGGAGQLMWVVFIVVTKQSGITKVLPVNSICSNMFDMFFQVCGSTSRPTQTFLNGAEEKHILGRAITFILKLRKKEIMEKPDVLVDIRQKA